MEISQLVIVAVLLLLLAEVTYILTKLPKQTASRRQKKMILVDTSVLIDGRIIAVAKSGFISDTLAIPRSVVGELQYLADNADHEKRARARHGLDIIAELQQISHIDVQVLQDSTTVKEGVDERLLVLAKKYHASVCTIDYNLNKVAIVEGIRVLNINELAQSLRMAYLPGEKTLLEMTQKGQDSHQAIGHLSDGTMVVVENAADKLGTTVEVEFIRSLQTAAGKMMFARLVDHTKPTQKQSHDSARSLPVTAKKPAGRKPGVTTKPHRNVDVPERRTIRREEPAISPITPPSIPKNNNHGNSKGQGRQNHSAHNRKSKRTDREDELLKLVDRQ
jgi:rRNA-processing protein FCF1